MQDVWESSSMNKSPAKHQDHAKSLLSPKQDLQPVRAQGPSWEGLIIALAPCKSSWGDRKCSRKKQVAEINTNKYLIFM